MFGSELGDSDWLKQKWQFHNTNPTCCLDSPKLMIIICDYGVWQAGLMMMNIVIVTVRFEITRKMLSIGWSYRGLQQSSIFPLYWMTMCLRKEIANCLMMLDLC